MHGPPVTVVTSACLNMVDLAGSERSDAGCALDPRMSERIAINTSLLALSNVIDALTAHAGGERRSHVPFRDSKLTRMLQVW